MRTRTTVTLLAIICGLTIWSQSGVSAQDSFEETSEYAEYIMFGYPRLEGLNLYDLRASRIQPEIWGRRRGVAQRTLVDAYYVQRSTNLVNGMTGLIVSPGVTIIGNPWRFGLIGTADVLNIFPRPVEEISLDPDDDPTAFRSLEDGRISAVHTLRGNRGLSGRVNYGELFGVRFDYERASFEHGLVSGTGSAASVSQTRNVVRERTFLELELGLRSVFDGAPSFVPNTLQLGVVNEDTLTPEGYTFLFGYNDEHLVADIGGGYGRFRNVLFGNARLDIRPLAAVTAMKAEHLLSADEGVEITQARLGIDWISYLVASLDEDIELRGTGSSFLGLEYANAPSDIAQRIDRSVPPPWSLVMRLSGAFDNYLFYLENNLSGWARMFADAENTGWIARFGIYLPSFRSFP